jgi:Fe-S cluster assembly iron-binding protein IscA
MLQVTQNAAVALATIREQENIPEDHNTLLTGEKLPSGDVSIRLEFVEDTAEEAQVTSEAGTDIYVAPDVADVLEQAVLDVQAGENGMAFVFRPQEG